MGSKIVEVPFLSMQQVLQTISINMRQLRLLASRVDYQARSQRQRNSRSYAPEPAVAGQRYPRHVSIIPHSTIKPPINWAATTQKEAISLKMILPCLMPHSSTL